MPLDELVFQRETLIRTMKKAISLLEKAAERYNPEEALPVDDTVAAVTLDTLRMAVSEYAKALMHHGASVTLNPHTKEKLENALRDAERKTRETE